MKKFIPGRAIFEPSALEYPLGKKLHEHFRELGIEIQTTPSHNRVTGIPGKTPREKYVQAKQSLVIGVRRTLKFSSCKPSAHYQLPLATSCPGFCEYCYLQTTLGPKPAVRVYVNIEEILEQAQKYIDERAPEITVFEGAATSDPIPVEYLTGSLERSIEFFAGTDLGRFRFVTKFGDVDSLLQIPHNGHTEIRFSLNTQKIIGEYEKGTAPLKERIEAARKISLAGYPFGFLIAPIITYENWKKEYSKVIEKLASLLSDGSNPSFELITHRFTKKAKSNIEKVFPESTLPMDEEERQYKYGQFGYGKWVYPKETMAEIRDFFQDQLGQAFPQSQIKYLV
ncbi:MAG TPA: spore photoproduct lyase [Firmicutes bacterium]|jgi:spore photoproduct lyase|nr:spore photoproduct lyase [Bacillota bacterium]